MLPGTCTRRGGVGQSFPALTSGSSIVVRGSQPDARCSTWNTARPCSNPSRGRAEEQRRPRCPWGPRLRTGRSAEVSPWSSCRWRLGRSVLIPVRAPPLQRSSDPAPRSRLGSLRRWARQAGPVEKRSAEGRRSGALRASSDLRTAGACPAPRFGGDSDRRGPRSTRGSGRWPRRDPPEPPSSARAERDRPPTTARDAALVVR